MCDIMSTIEKKTIPTKLTVVVRRNFYFFNFFLEF